MVSVRPVAALSSWFRFTVPGQPVSWNHSYRWTTKKSPGGEVRIQVKKPEAVAFQQAVTLIASAAKPSDFRPEGQIIVGYEFLLGRSIDADNVMKMLNDALARNVLGVNDKRFLQVVLRHETGHRNPCVIVHVWDAAEWSPVVVRKVA
jgi:Holliday junction resolvase RusA-like endonuclease